MKRHTHGRNTLQIVIFRSFKSNQMALLGRLLQVGRDGLHELTDVSLHVEHRFGLFLHFLFLVWN